MTHRWRTNDRRAPRALHGIAVGVVASALACAGCAGDDSIGPTISVDSGADATDATGSASDGGDAASPIRDSGRAAATFSSTSLDLGDAGCGAAAVTTTFSVVASGQIPLAVSATTTGSAFSVTPTSLVLSGGGGDGGTGTFVVSAAVPGSATAGVPLQGSLNLFTNDPANANVAVPLSVTPTGATLAFAPGAPVTVSFPTTEIGSAAPPARFTVVNAGKEPGTFLFGPQTTALLSLPLASVTYPLDPGATLALTAQFTPTNSAPAVATSAVTATGPLCGRSLSAISFSGQGSVGVITGYPTAAIDFGAVACGGAPPAGRSFRLTKSGGVTAHIVQASLDGAPGFTTSAAKGRYILPNGGVLAINVSAPPVPALASLTPIRATLTIQTDADPAPQVISLVEEPTGAVLGFTTSGASSTASFGDFGSVVLLGSATQTFGVTNTGNAPADVALAIAPNVTDGGVASPTPFSLSTAAFSLAAGGAETDSVVFAPTSASVASGALTLTTTSASALRFPPGAAPALGGRERAGARPCFRPRSRSPRPAAVRLPPRRRSPSRTRGRRT